MPKKLADKLSDLSRKYGRTAHDPLEIYSLAIAEYIRQYKERKLGKK